MLENLNWKEFFIEDIAEIASGKDIYEVERVPGNTPYITSTALKNGIGYFVSNNNDSLEANCLSVNRNGSVGYSFYHPYPALYSNDCRKLRLKKTSESIALFISQQITAQRKKYGYGYKMGTGRLKRQKIMLPVKSNGSPDYEFMEKYISNLREKKENQYRIHVQESLKLLKRTPNVVSLEQKTWSEFTIGEIFRIKPGKRLTKADMQNGKYPFVGASDSNNGITAFVSNENPSMDSNVLGVNYNGSVVENFYHPYNALFSDDVKRFSLKNFEGNKHVYLFLKMTILKQKIKYQYGYKFNEKRMLRQKIMLPIDLNGLPDFLYMTNYMKKIEYKILQNYLRYSSEK